MKQSNFTRVLAATAALALVARAAAEEPKLPPEILYRQPPPPPTSVPKLPCLTAEERKDMGAELAHWREVYAQFASAEKDYTEARSKAETALDEMQKSQSKETQEAYGKAVGRVNAAGAALKVALTAVLATSDRWWFAVSKASGRICDGPAETPRQSQEEKPSGPAVHEIEPPPLPRTEVEPPSLPPYPKQKDETSPEPGRCDASRLLAAVNAVRTDPKGYAKKLRAGRQGPGVADAIAWLESHDPVPPLQIDGRLADAAEAHIADEGPRGAADHVGSDGSKPKARMTKAGMYATTYSEVISIAEDAPEDAVRQLIVDIVPGHPHRLDLMDPLLKLLGGACGPNKTYGRMWVIDMTDAPVPR